MSRLRCVLVVEDTEDDRYLAHRVLRKVWPEVEVLNARDGEEAIELLDDLSRPGGQMPDLILLDINMPRMGGHEFLERRYESGDLDIPVVVMLTSSGSDVDRERSARFACVRDYLVKPLTREAAGGLPDMLYGAAQEREIISRGVAGDSRKTREDRLSSCPPRDGVTRDSPLHCRREPPLHERSEGGGSRPMNTLSRVLLVEDTEADRYLASRMLRKVWPGIDVVEARDGEEAIELLERCDRTRLPEIILLDINMPRMDGHEFLEAWYASRGLDIPIVMMLTSSGQAIDRERVAGFRCVRDYVVKPIDREAVKRLPDLLAAA